jgi:glycerol-3-phosphate acyltransferase PlsY
MICIILSLIIAYLFGSIPSAVWIGKIYFGIDIREHGSHNAGATNTFRVLGKKPGMVVLIIDVMKGVFATLIPIFLIGDNILDLELKVRIACAFLAVLGHLFPLFAGFRGGKGVATSLGVVIGIAPMAAAISLIIFVIVFLSSRFVSLGAMVAALFFPFVLKYILGSDSFWLLSFGVVVGCMVIVAHRRNIQRLLKGEENKMNFSRR